MLENPQNSGDFPLVIKGNNDVSETLIETGIVLPAQVVQQYNIAIDQIEVKDRLRPLDPQWVEAIAGSIKERGQLQAIEVCQLPGRAGYRLTFGAHRFAAIMLLGWTTIRAEIGTSDKGERRAREIIENVFRRDLDPLDRAAFVAELYQLEKARVGMPIDGDGRAFSAGVRWQKSLKAEGSHATVMITGAYGMQDEVARKVGLSVESIKKDLLLFKRLAPSLVERVRKLPIASNATALRQLASMEPSDQNQAVTLMEGGRAKGIAEATAIITKRVAPDPTKKRLGTFVSTFSRMSTAERKVALRELSGLVPKDFKIVEERQEPAVPIRKSIGVDYVVCLEDGRKVKSLNAYLQARFGMSADEYRAKWNLPKDYPMVAPAHSKKRAELVQEMRAFKGAAE